jgi:TRAP-type C4-dicarboxylate transport system permease small subunit
MTGSSKRPPLRWDHLFAALFLGAMALIAFMNILGRYFFHYSLAFTEEITIHLFVWLTVIGSGLAFERGAHLGMVTLSQRFPFMARKVLVCVNAMLGAVLFVAVDLLLIQAIYQEITLFHAKSSAFGLPIWIYYAGVPLFSIYVFRGIYRGAMNQIGTLKQEER